MGNLIPALVWLPPAGFGLAIAAAKGDVTPTSIWLLVSASVLGWLTLNQVGLFENARMKAQLGRILQAKGTELPPEHWFVGFASPTYSSALDAHEDVGFLGLTPDRAVFVSETRELEILRADVTEVRFRGNVHSLLFLGRWVSIEGKVGPRSIRMTIEPREHRTLLRNRRASAELLVRLEEWRKSGQTATNAG